MELRRFTVETVNENRDTVHRHKQERVRVEAGLFYNRESGRDDEPRLEVSIQYQYDSGRTRGCFSYIPLTPEQCREFANILTETADAAERMTP